MAERPGKRPGRSLEIEPGAGPVERPEEVGEGSNTLFDFSGDARIRVLRRDDKTQKYVSHGFLPVAASEEDVGAEWGGGRYRVQLCVPDGTGREVIKTQREFDLPGAYRPPTEMAGVRAPLVVKPGSNTPVASIPSTVVPGSQDMASMLNATMMTTFMDLIKTMKEVSSRPTQQTDPMLLEMIRSISAQQSKMFEVILPLILESRKGDSKKDVLDLIGSLKDLMGPQQPVNPSDPSKVLEGIVSAIKQLRDVSDELSPEKSGTGDPLMDSLPRLTEIIAEEQKFRRGQVQQPQRRLQSGQQQAQVQAQPPQPQPQPEQQDLKMWQKVVRSYGNQLLSSARSGKNPELIADMAVAFAPDDIKGVFTELCRGKPEDVAAQIIGEIPGLEEFPGWMYQFVEQIQFRLFPEEFEDYTDGTVEEEEILETGQAEGEHSHGTDN